MSAKSYSSVRLYLWSFAKRLEENADKEIDEAVVAKPNPSRSATVERFTSDDHATTRKQIRRTVDKALLRGLNHAREHGVHILGCDHSSLDPLVRTFAEANVHDNTSKDHRNRVLTVREAGAISLNKAAGNRHGKKGGYLVYGGALGLLHVIARPEEVFLHRYEDPDGS